ncbi:hypothetical protein DSS3P1_25 [Ruegeria phage DSS3-P1]|nr:hypothetical protein DSS3P1_25 [Ruegeria phage DSS3-P1]YP_009997407.1 hypothetical protein JT314_gp26 [Ruegeria phage vB_RpoS-V7]AIT13260.1 hypothetical protein DSS3P1_25 [Ruegeria phage DSS3-P1]AWY08729.1 hypothetical protein vBRpoSV7_26 [Ruegeria phage vB_RpoS-V7]
MIGIRITGYESRQGLTTYRFHITPETTITGKEDQFAYGYSHAQSMKDGLQAAMPGHTFEIREIDCDSHGAYTQINGECLFDIQRKLKEEAA